MCRSPTVHRTLTYCCLFLGPGILHSADYESFWWGHKRSPAWVEGQVGPAHQMSHSLGLWPLLDSPVVSTPVWATIAPCLEYHSSLRIRLPDSSSRPLQSIFHTSTTGIFINTNINPLFSHFKHVNSSLLPPGGKSQFMIMAPKIVLLSTPWCLPPAPPQSHLFQSQDHPHPTINSSKWLADLGAPSKPLYCFFLLPTSHPPPDAIPG